MPDCSRSISYPRKARKSRTDEQASVLAMPKMIFFVIFVPFVDNIF